jgi:hypothetical protein
VREFRELRLQFDSIPSDAADAARRQPASNLAVPVTVIVALMVMVVMIMAVMVMIVAMRVAMIVPVMFMALIMPMRAAVVGLERGHHHRGSEAALRQQLRDIGMREHAQPVGEDLDGDVTVAQRQHEPRGLGEILLAHLEHGFDVGHDFHETAVVEQQEIVGAQERGHREIEFDTGPLGAEHETLLLRAVLEFEEQRVDDFAGGFAGAENFLRARHGAIQNQ